MQAERAIDNFVQVFIGPEVRCHSAQQLLASSLSFYHVAQFPLCA